MSSNRNAELQRKLTLAAVPRPPADLADRIKNDIPQYLKVTQDERERFTRSMAFNLRVAASILLLFSSLFVCLYLVTRKNESALLMHEAKQSDATVPMPTRPPTEEVHVQIAQLRASDARTVPAPQPVRLAEHDDEVRIAEPEGEPRRDRATENFVEDAVQETVSVSASAPPVAAVPPPPPPAEPALRAEAGIAAYGYDGRFSTAGAPASATVSADTARRATSLDFVVAAHAADLDLGPHGSAFGITIDPEAFQRLKMLIENGDRPKADSVDVEALVNYFAGSPKRSRREVQLEVEGSPAPVGVEGHRGIVRFTIDTATVDVQPNGSVPPVGTDASVAVKLDDRAVESFRAIGEQQNFVITEAILQKNVSVTGLYEVKLRSGLTSREQVATVTFSYRSIATGRNEKFTRTLYGSDFSKPWAEATRRHRLASLGAVWGETLKGMATGADVAKAAEELATQEPKDARAKELANLATAASRLRSSSPTGSGR
ncbi:MAG TPA: von Willebrand factor type A domain-containing protein [Thermoanaerobaculia bacterium]|nr:von Willebrand factor type A domain-containing protein [Thermoanaerobaculia bacterium]